MKRSSFFSVVCLLICLQTIGQQGQTSVGAGPVVGFPAFNKNYSFYYKKGIGGAIQANFGITKLGSVTAGLTIVSIGSRNQPASKTSLTLLKGGYRTNFSNTAFFVATDAGIGRYGSAAGTHFVIGGTVGYTFTLSKGSVIDLFPTYNLIAGTGSNNMWLMVNVLYRFNLKKNK